MRLILFGFLLFGSFLSQGLRAYEFQDWEYQQIRRTSLAIIQGKPSSQYVIVGIGRSPTPFTAFIQNLDPAHAINVPLSNIGLIRPNSLSGELSPDKEAELFRHLDRYLKQPLGNGKKLVVVDFVSRGNSFKGLSYYLDRYVRSSGKSEALEYCMLGSSEYFNKLKAQSQSSRYRFLEIPNDLYEDNVSRRLARKEYKNYSEFGQFDSRLEDGIKQDTAPVVRPEFDQFKNDLKKRMLKDDLLRDKLGSNGSFADCKTQTVRSLKKILASH